MKSMVANVMQLFFAPFGRDRCRIRPGFARRCQIQPIHSLVAGVMEGVGEPSLIVRGYGSPHAYQMRPSDAATLQTVDIVFWVGLPMETFLQKPISVLPRRATVVELTRVSDLTLLENRHGRPWEGGHSHEA